MEPFTAAQAGEYLKQVPGWKLAMIDLAISRRFKFKNFKQALEFVNKVGKIAEDENHHPDIAVGWGYVAITCSTHAIKGLSENDFILASKINTLT